ncbi:hypothetical protein [Salinarchaeum laminariae]|uniref:hypothetical protein n=1 Tax=Salinarchaeum laminariae TaxID=869888 RepID=UPI0020BDC0C8|nr:hypothetical protein [Salinarchaeum laminariae]
MNWNILNSIDRENRVPNTVAFLALVAIAGIVGVAAISGGAVAAEPLNETVEVGNDTGTVYTEVTFASGINDSNATADVVVTDANGTTVANTTISGNASETVVEEWAVNDSDPIGNWSVVLTADSGVVDSAEAGTFVEGGSGGGGAGSSDDGWGSMWGIPIFALVIGAVAALLFVGNRRDWFEDLY